MASPDHVEDDWAAFGEAPPTETLPTGGQGESVPALPQTSSLPQNSGLPQMSNTSLVGFKIDEQPLAEPLPTTGIPKVSSASAIDSRLTGDLNDNDSDWSGFSAPAAVQPDNISSDWSFKDNTSVHEDVKSISSGGLVTDNSKTAVDWTESSKPAADWTSDFSTAVEPSTAVEWQAFEGDEVATEHVDTGEEQRSRSSTVKEQPATDSIGSQLTFNSGPPPFSPKSISSTMSSSASKSNDDWPVSADDTFTLKELPPALDSTPSTSTEPSATDSTKASNPHQFSPLKDNSVDEWGDFGTHSRNTSDSPIMFSPPPLTDSDFSPHKSVSKTESDWFSFADKAETSSAVDVNPPIRYCSLVYFDVIGYRGLLKMLV